MYEIWAEGFVDQGGRGIATCLGKVEGTDFKDACSKLAEQDEEFKKYFDPDSMTYWGCRLFDNEVEARKSFG